MVGFFRKEKKVEKPGGKTERYRELSFPPGRSRPAIESREFKLFKKREDLPLTWFERIAKISGNILSVNPPDESTKKDL